MQHTDDIVSGWLGGNDRIDGMQNPAGPLYIEGEAAMEAAMTNPYNANITTHSVTAVTCGGTGSCICT